MKKCYLCRKSGANSQVRIIRELETIVRRVCGYCALSVMASGGARALAAVFVARAE